MRETHVELVGLDALAVRDARRGELVVLDERRTVAQSGEQPLEQRRLPLEYVDVVDPAPIVGGLRTGHVDQMRERMRLVGDQQILVRARRQQDDHRDHERDETRNGQIQWPKDAPRIHGPRVDRVSDHRRRGSPRP